MFKNLQFSVAAVGRSLRDALQAGQDEFEQSALLMEALQQAPISEMLLRRWGRTLAKHGIAFSENEEAADRLELFLDMWDSFPPDDRLP